MNCASWNVRGLCEASKALSVGSWLQQNNICLCGLLETRVKRHWIESVASSIAKSWHWYSYQQFHNRVRILLGWKPALVDVVVDRVHLQYVHCHVTVWKSGFRFWFTVVYGLNSLADKKDLWQGIVALSKNMVEPWCVMGDFNAIFDIIHRSNGRLVSAYEMQDFLQCIEDAQLVSPRSVGHWFSWHNKASSEDIITSRIDHAFVND